MTEQELFEKALCFATEKHSGQTRQDGSPYIYHPIKVAEFLKDAGYDLRYQMAGLLHDVLEDTDMTKEEMAAEFNAEVAEIVDGVTKISKLKYRTKEKALA